MISTIIMQIQAVRTSLFLSLWWHKERDTIIKNIILTPNHHAWRILRCLRSQFISARQVPNWSALIRPEKPNCMLQRSNLNYSSFQNPQILRTTSSGRDVNPPVQRLFSPIYCLGVYYDRWWLSYPFHTGVWVHYPTIVPEIRDTD